MCNKVHLFSSYRFDILHLTSFCSHHCYKKIGILSNTCKIREFSPSGGNFNFSVTIRTGPFSNHYRKWGLFHTHVRKLVFSWHYIQSDFPPTLESLAATISVGLGLCEPLQDMDMKHFLTSSESKTFSKHKIQNSKITSLFRTLWASGYSSNTDGNPSQTLEFY